MESRIINLIKNNPRWADELQELNVKIKINEENYAIFNYGIGADFTNPIVKEARGIIIDLDTMTVACWPYKKFFNSVEPEAADDLNNFDWSSCRVEDKIDGSLIKLWYDRKSCRWQWSTNSCISADEANANDTGKTFAEIIAIATNYKNIKYDELDTNLTYMFELVSPLTQIVVYYPATKLYHIGTRNNITGEEYKMYIGIEQPKTYQIHSLDDCLNAATKLNGSGDVKKEGFVVVDQYWHRIKVKSPEYLATHHDWNNGNIKKEVFVFNKLATLDAGGYSSITRKDLLQLYYDFQVEDLLYRIDRYIDYVRGLYAEVESNRKTVANIIKNDKFAPFGFAAIGNDKNAAELLMECRLSTICKLVPDYVNSGIYKEVSGEGDIANEST